MQTAFLKILLLSSALLLVASLSQAKRFAWEYCDGGQCQMNLQGVVNRPAHSLPIVAMHLSSPGVEPHDQIVGGLSLDFVLSAGSAQQSVNQEGVRDKPAKQDAAKGDSEKQNSQSEQTRNKDARPTGSVRGKSNIEAVGESGNGSTASGSAEGPFRRPPVQENW
jgi:hypothetical protein